MSISMIPFLEACKKAGKYPPLKQVFSFTRNIRIKVLKINENSHDIVNEMPVRPTDFFDVEPQDCGIGVSESGSFEAQNETVLRIPEESEEESEMKSPCVQPPVPLSYNDAREAVTSGMVSNLEGKTLIVFCTTDFLRPEFVVTMLGKFDKDVEIRNRWIPAEDPRQKVWSGVVALFTSEDGIFPASKELKRHSKFIKIIRFLEFMTLFLDAEIRHDLYGCYFTAVRISGKTSFLTKHITQIENLLYTLGNVKAIQYHEVSSYGVICEVVYAFATHAFAAQTILNDMFFKEVGHIVVEVIETSKEKSILKTVKQQLALGEYMEWI